MNAVQKHTENSTISKKAFYKCVVCGSVYCMYIHELKAKSISSSGSQKFLIIILDERERWTVFCVHTDTHSHTHTIPFECVLYTPPIAQRDEAGHLKMSDLNGMQFQCKQILDNVDDDDTNDSQ